MYLSILGFFFLADAGMKKLCAKKLYKEKYCLPTMDDKKIEKRL